MGDSVTPLPSIRDKSAAWRQEIVWWEICSILHDIGKLSADFHRYRQIWMSLPEGWNTRDPHDHNWLQHDRELDKVPALRSFFKNPIPGLTLAPAPAAGPKLLSVIEAVDRHSSGSSSRLVKLLQLGDRIDARQRKTASVSVGEELNGDVPGAVGPVLKSFKSRAGSSAHQSSRTICPQHDSPCTVPSALISKAWWLMTTRNQRTFGSFNG